MRTGAPAGRRLGGRGLAAALALGLAIPSAGRAQAQGTASGRVLRPGVADTMAVPGVRVVLHRVRSDAQGPLDSTVSGPSGGFRFRFLTDSGAVYLLSARYHGIEYFSPPVPAAATTDTALRLFVYDTSSTAPVAIGARHVIVPRAGEDGGREVLELIVLRNESHLARVAPDSLGSSWSMPLPPGSEGLEAGESDVSSDAIGRRGDSLLVAAPIAPGEKQLTVSYHLPAGMRAVAVPAGAAGGSMNVLIEDRGASVAGPGLARADSQVVLGRTFSRWAGEVPAGALVRVTLPGLHTQPWWLLPGLVAAVAIGLAIAGWRVARSGAGPPAAPVAPAGVVEREALLHRVARLDAEYAGRQGEVPDDEWRRYVDDRARLKQELEAALAAGRARQ
ncbi:MAG TPA: hypothetical protein VEB59_04690 [Gemmatimonadales bacterium]|nr:hypothetical protein [Gemmatimonadales bacterium]